MHNAFSPSFYAGDAWGSFNSLMRMIIEMAQIKPGEKVLDVGAQGHGECNNPDCACHTLGPDACEKHLGEVHEH